MKNIKIKTDGKEINNLRDILLEFQGNSSILGDMPESITITDESKLSDFNFNWTALKTVLMLNFGYELINQDILIWKLLKELKTTQ